MIGLGISLCATDVGSTVGVGLIASGVSSLASTGLRAAGFDPKTATMLSAGVDVVGGAALLLTPFTTVGAGIIGSGFGSLAGGAISGKLGYSYELGAAIGNIVGGTAGNFAFRGATKFKAMNKLNKFIQSGDAKGKAATIAAYDVMVAVGVSGASPENAPSALVKRAIKAGGIGNTGINSPNSVGACAEFRAAYQLVQGGSQVSNIRFTPALRHNNKGINVVATCDNCKDIFPQALSWITRLF